MFRQNKWKALIASVWLVKNKSVCVRSVFVHMTGPGSLRVWPCVFELPFKHQSTLKLFKTNRPAFCCRCRWRVCLIPFSRCLWFPPPLQRVQNILFCESVELQARGEYVYLWLSWGANRNGPVALTYTVLIKSLRA